MQMPTEMEEGVPTMVHQPTDANHISFLGGGPALSVKNSFVHYDTPLNFDDEIEPPELRRRSTAPAKVEHEESDSDEDVETDDEAQFWPASYVATHAQVALAQEAAGTDESGSPKQVLGSAVPTLGPESLCRHTTYDGFEPEEQKSFVQPQAPAFQEAWGVQMNVPHLGSEAMLPVMASGTEMSTGLHPAAWVPVWPPLSFFSRHEAAERVVSHAKPW